MTTQTANPQGPTPTIHTTGLPGLPRGPLTPAQQLEALRRVQLQAEQRVKLGAQFFKAAEARVSEQRQALDLLRRDLEAHAGEIDQRVNEIDRRLSERTDQLGQRLETQMEQWGESRRQMEALLRRAEALLDQSRCLLAGPKGGVRSQVEDATSKVQHLEVEVQSLKSKFQSLEGEVQDPKSKVQCLEVEVQRLKSQVQGFQVIPVAKIRHEDHSPAAAVQGSGDRPAVEYRAEVQIPAPTVESPAEAKPSTLAQAAAPLEVAGTEVPTTEVQSPEAQSQEVPCPQASVRETPSLAAVFQDVRNSEGQSPVAQDSESQDREEYYVEPASGQAPQPATDSPPVEALEASVVAPALAPESHAIQGGMVNFSYVTSDMPVTLTIGDQTGAPLFPPAWQPPAPEPATPVLTSEHLLAAAPDQPAPTPPQAIQTVEAPKPPEAVAPQDALPATASPLSLGELAEFPDAPVLSAPAESGESSGTETMAPTEPRICYTELLRILRSTQG